MICLYPLGGRGLGRLRLSSWLTKSLYKDGDIRNSKYNIHRDFYYNDPKNAKFGQKIPFQGADTLYWICPVLQNGIVSMKKTLTDGLL